MSQRTKEGATLALTVTGVFFIILLGVGFSSLSSCSAAVEKLNTPQTPAT